MSDEDGDVREVKILNQIVRWTSTGIELEAEPRHADIVIRELGLEQARSSAAPGAKAVKTEGLKIFRRRGRLTDQRRL